MNSKSRSTYILLGGALLLSSCAQVDTPTDRPDGSDRRIAMNVSLPEITTRAKEITKEPLEYFNMTAFNVTDPKYIDENNKLNEYFIDKKMEKSTVSGKYKNDECMWPEQGRESDVLHFFAYYPPLSGDAELANETVIDADSDQTATRYKVNGFNVATDLNDQVDFVTAYATGSMDDNYFSGINLKFRHQLSRIEVKAKGKHKSCDIQIAGVRIVNAGMKGTFEFQTSDDDGVWKDVKPGISEYIFREGDAIVTISSDPASNSDPISILGSKDIDGGDNCALLIPASYSAWDYTGDAANNGKGMYLNVLLRIIDTTHTTGNGKQQYPYLDNSQGLNALNTENIPREYFAVEKTSGKVIKRIYKSESGGYFTDEDHNQPYTLAAGEEVREFGWAALPIEGEWKPGYTYCYTLDYSGGIGVHGPDVKGDVSPKAGDPVISDKVGVSVNVNGWQGLNGTTTHDFEVPGS